MSKPVELSRETARTDRYRHRHGDRDHFHRGHFHNIPRGALLLVSDVPTIPDGVKTEASDRQVSEDWSDHHLDLGISAMSDIAVEGEPKHFVF